jgi:hypothetical protein
LIRTGVLWLLLLGPFFFLSYGWPTATRQGARCRQPGVRLGTAYAVLWPWTIVPYWSIDLFYGLLFLLPHRREMDRHACAAHRATDRVAASCSGRCASPSSARN